jgi:hypothetical protein
MQMERSALFGKRTSHRTQFCKSERVSVYVCARERRREEKEPARKAKKCAKQRINVIGMPLACALARTLFIPAITTVGHPASSRKSSAEMSAATAKETKQNRKTGK